MLIKDKEWGRYSKIINEFVGEDAGLQPFFWLKISTIPTLPYGEDKYPHFTKIELKGLFHYNYIRTWPYNKETVSGASSSNNVALYITKEYLNELGYLDDYGYWKLNTVSDRFILNGKAYKPSGDIQVAQAKNNPLLFFIIFDALDESEEEELLKRYMNV